MLREHVKELLPIIIAFGEGKTIQINLYQDGKTWKDVIGNPSFCSHPKIYRIKPNTVKVSPYRRYIWKHPDGVNYYAATAVKDANYDGRIEKMDCFVKWIDDDWVVHEVEAT